MTRWKVTLIVEDAGYTQPLGRSPTGFSCGPYEHRQRTQAEMLEEFDGAGIRSELNTGLSIASVEVAGSGAGMTRSEAARQYARSMRFLIEAEVWKALPTTRTEALRTNVEQSAKAELDLATAIMVLTSGPAEDDTAYRCCWTPYATRDQMVAHVARVHGERWAPLVVDKRGGQLDCAGCKHPLASHYERIEGRHHYVNCARCPCALAEPLRLAGDVPGEIPWSPIP